MINRLGVIALAVSALTMAGATHASLIDDEVRADVFTTGFVTYIAGNATVVDPGVEFPNSLVPNLDITLDFNASSSALTITRSPIPPTLLLVNGVTFSLSSLDWFGMPTGILEDIVFTSADLTVSGITVGDHSADFTVFAPNNLFVSGQMFSANVDFITNHVVSEPMSLALFTLGLAGLGLRRRLAG